GRPARAALRGRRLILSALLAGAVVMTVAAPAMAEDPGHKHDRELFECIEKATKADTNKNGKVDYIAYANDVEDCKKSKSIISPAAPELIWGSIAFLIVLVVLLKFAFPGLKKSLKQRADKIREDLEKAEAARREAEDEKRQYEAQIADARSEANRIVEEAREAAEQVRRDLTSRAEADAAEVRSRAQADAQLAVQNAMSDLQHRVADLSIELAEKIVERNLDHDTQLALVESYISSVGTAQRG